MNEQHAFLRRAARPRARPRRRRGAVLVLVVVLLIVFFATVAFSVDVAYMHLANAELRAATDAAAKAAITDLGMNQDVGRARQAAKRMAAANVVAGRPLTLADADIVFGKTQIQSGGVFAFVPGSTPYGAVQVTGRKLRSSPSGSVGLFFGGLLGAPDFQPQIASTAARLDRDICLVLDRSGSMLDDNKLEDCKVAVRVFLAIMADSEEEELIGLVSYSTTATLDQGLTSRLSVIQGKVDAMKADGYTNISGGIDTGRTVLRGGHNPQYAYKTMILMTDGIENRGRPCEQAARDAAREGIVIHTISFGSDADQRRMRSVAEITGGTFRHAPDGEALRRAFQDIARTVCTVLTQ